MKQRWLCLRCLAITENPFSWMTCEVITKVPGQTGGGSCDGKLVKTEHAPQPAQRGPAVSLLRSRGTV